MNLISNAIVTSLVVAGLWLASSLVMPAEQVSATFGRLSHTLGATP